MLTHLFIQNYALIEKLDLDFAETLNIITGETGAGKSIMIGALSLILGERADTKVLLYKDKKCIVEGTFLIKGLDLADFFRNNEIDYDNQTIIRREINEAGKSRAFVNDTPVNLNILKELTSKLVDIHSQHQTLNLKSFEFQLTVLDSFSGNISVIKDYQKLFNELKEKQHNLSQLIDKEHKLNADADYYQFQLNELQNAGLIPGEQEKTEEELKLLENAEEIKAKLSLCFKIFEENEQSLLPQMDCLNSHLASITVRSKQLDEIYARLKMIQIDLKDISSEIERMEQNTEFDPVRIGELNQRLDVIYKLQKKHGVTSVQELIFTLDELNKKVLDKQSLADDIGQLEKELSLLKSEALLFADKLHNNREKASGTLEKKINQLLKELALPNALLQVEIIKRNREELNKFGYDNVKFLFSANKGIKAMEVGEAASGGELSRLMLAIKSLLTESTSLPTIIFDEIDTGVSGDVAFRVGDMLKSVSRHHQVFSITHLPQIAGKGNAHYFVYKQILKGTTFTFVKKLTENERIVEIAKMIGGAKPTDTAVKNAKELLSN